MNQRLINVSSSIGLAGCCRFVSRLACGIVVVVLLAACSPSAPLEIEQLHVFRPPPGQTTAAAYGLLRNNTENTLVLNYVHSAVAEEVEVHRVIYDQGMMKMRKVNHLTIDPGESITFQPGGYHLMLMGVEELPAAGAFFDIELEFEAGYSIVGKAEVRSIRQGATD